MAAHTGHGIVVGTGISISAVSLQSSVAYFSNLYGKESFLWINIAIYLPALPVSLFMIHWSTLQRGKCPDSEQTWCETRRLIVSFVLLAVIGMSVASTNSLWSLLLVSFMTGVFSTVAYCSAFQIAMSCADADNLRIGLNLGYQGSVVVVIVAQELSGLQPGSALADVWFFFSVVALLSLAATVSAYKLGIVCIKLSSETSESLLSDELLPDGHADREDEEEKYSYSEVLVEIRSYAMVLFATVFGSIVIFPFYSYVPSSSSSEVTQRFLPMYMFYTKSFSDLASRVACLFLPKVASASVLLWCSLARLSFVPYFLAYCFTNVFYQSDLLILGAVAFYSFTSGLFITYAYTLVPTKDSSAEYTRKASSMMSVTFQLAITAALVCSTIAYYVIN